MKLTIEESLKILKSAGMVCERYRGDNYVMDHLDSVEVPRYVHSKLGGAEHVFSVEDEWSSKGLEMEEMRIYHNGKYEVLIKTENSDRVISSGLLELPMLFWKSSSYRGGEESRVSNWIRNQMFKFVRSKGNLLGRR